MISYGMVDVMGVLDSNRIFRAFTAEIQNLHMPSRAFLVNEEI